MDISEIYEIKDMYDVELMLLKYCDILAIIKNACSSEDIIIEHLITVLDELIFCIQKIY